MTECRGWPAGDGRPVSAGGPVPFHRASVGLRRPLWLGDADGSWLEACWVVAGRVPGPRGRGRARRGPDRSGVDEPPCTTLAGGACARGGSAGGGQRLAPPHGPGG